MGINTFEQLLEECNARGKRIWQVAQAYESEWCEVPVNLVRQCAENSLKAMKEAIRKYLISQGWKKAGLFG